jgi:hypothetical protein
MVSIKWMLTKAAWRGHFLFIFFFRKHKAKRCLVSYLKMWLEITIFRMFWTHSMWYVSLFWIFFAAIKNFVSMSFLFFCFGTAFSEYMNYLVLSINGTAVDFQVILATIFFGLGGRDVCLIKWAFGGSTNFERIFFTIVITKMSGLNFPSIWFSNPSKSKKRLRRRTL